MLVELIHVHVWWVGLGWIPVAYQVTLSLPSSTGQEEGENKIEKNLMDQEKGISI